MDSRCELSLMRFVIASLAVALLSSTSAFAVPTITRVECGVRHNLRGDSNSVGAFEKTMCILRVGLSDSMSLGSQRFSGGEEHFGCPLEKGEVTCLFSDDELAAMNSLLQNANVNPKVFGYTFHDRSSLEREHGCLQTFPSSKNFSPFVAPDPELKVSGSIGRKCQDNSNCEIKISYQYDCISLPEEEEEPESDPDPTDEEAFASCRSDYQACISDNVRLQVRLGQCRGGIGLVVPLATFTGGVSECQQYLGACQLSTFQLNDAVSQCEASN